MHGPRMPAAKLGTEHQHQDRRHQERHQYKSVSQEIVDIPCSRRRPLAQKGSRERQKFRVPSAVARRGGCGSRGFAELFATILRRESLPQQGAEEKNVNTQAGGGEQKAAWRGQQPPRQWLAREGRGKEREIRQKAQHR